MVKKSKYVKAKYKPLYPSSSERELAKMAVSYMSIVSEVVSDNLTSLLGEEYQLAEKNTRSDAKLGDLAKTISSATKAALKMIEDAGIKSVVGKVAKRVKKSAVREWDLVIRKTFGEEFGKHHMDDEFYKKTLDDWIKLNEKIADEFVKDVFAKLKKCISDGIKAGETPVQIAEKIKKIIQSETNHAMQLSKDQVAALNTAIEKLHCKKFGSDRYMWITKRDDKVRPCHRTLHGKIYSWDDPPEMWHISVTGEVVMDGRKCHPGEDYRCRCIALPIFDRDKLNLAITK